VAAAEQTRDPSALTDVGFAHHAGTVPSPDGAEGATLPPDVDAAVRLYGAAAAQGYAPASSLLADVHYYGAPPTHPVAHARAAPHLRDVLTHTSEGEPDDAYARVRALRKLGAIHRPSDAAASRAAFAAGLDTCQAHLGGHFAFLLQHDPVGLWEHLEAERLILDDVPEMIRKLSPFVSGRAGLARLEAEAALLAAAVTLRSYTNALRDTENGDRAWILRLTDESLARFPVSSDAASWGVTYLQSFMKIMGAPPVQKALAACPGVPHVVSLGSALGSSIVWPAAAFGFTGVGFDALSAAVEKSTALVGDLAGKGGEAVQGAVEFRTGDVLEAEAGVEEEIRKADIVWLNDFSWGQDSNQAVEQLCFQSMKRGAMLVLYRSPADKSLQWEIGGVVRVPLSWHPSSNVVLLRKP